MALVGVTREVSLSYVEIEKLLYNCLVKTSDELLVLHSVLFFPFDDFPSFASDSICTCATSQDYATQDRRGLRHRRCAAENAPRLGLPR